MKKTIGLLLITLLTILLYSGCKKGCTDVNALNYTSGAKTEDGSCFYCDSSITQQTITFGTFWDNQPGSPYYGSNIISAELNLVQTAYNGNGCVRYGFKDPNAACTQSACRVVLFNLTSSEVTFTGNMTILIGTFPGNTVFSKQVSSVVIMPQDSVVIDNIGNVCISEGNFFGGSVDCSNPQFSYN